MLIGSLRYTWLACLRARGKKDVYRLVGDFNAEIGYLFMSVSILGTDKAALSI